jgi:hypothetical protein
VRAGLHSGESNDVTTMSPASASTSEPESPHWQNRTKSLLQVQSKFVISSELDFADRGTHLPRGVPGDWHLWAAKLEPISHPEALPSYIAVSLIASQTVKRSCGSHATCCKVSRFSPLGP